MKRRLKTQNSGEDSFFVQDLKDRSGVAVGIADGVGGWSESGVDPGVFSQALMYHAARYAKRGWADDSYPSSANSTEESIQPWELTPENCLELAFNAVLRDTLVDAGSSTGLISTFNARSGLMKAANLGDSGFMIIRNRTALHVQEPQTHFFNCPKQLSKIPRRMRQPGLITDSPKDADLYECRLRHGDIVVCYTDGVSDNVWPQELIAISAVITRQGGSEQEIAQNMADAVVEYAMKAMHRKDRVSPFEHAAALERQRWAGGKVDDATALAILVSEEVHEPSTEVPMV
ncbi:hypothetical protein M407DRAFT_240612 [Tulasnella calospora MUT 4182]|uniref:Protein phosphatase n=1 Tax=Tulasnella calospora MUT 4182 TaxID=1051891 RepID=A0A0C3QYF1_9AGAM|nr:hypothetical protein M407DRAFT_240612 [Tulasnella calospora MUT 4182]